MTSCTTLPPVPSFTVQTAEHDNATHVLLRGDLDLSTAKQAEQAIEDAERSGQQTVVVDLRGLSFMDSTGLRVIVSADKRASRSNRRLVIIQGPLAVRRVFEITRLGERLDIVDTPEEIEAER
jgi:anti-sigma B factor antagonist